MKPTSKDIYTMLVQGYLVSEIKRKYDLTELEWQRLTNRVEFIEMLHSPKIVPDLLKIKEIEETLFNLLDIKKPSQDVRRRISSLQTNYSRFLVC